MNRRLLVALPLLALAALFYGWFSEPDSNAPHPRSNSETGADFWLEGMDMARLNANGELDSRMTARKESYYSNIDIHEFSQPHIVIYRGRELPWVVDAKSGRSEEAGKLIRLFGETRIERDQPGGEDWSRIDTRDLRYWPDKKIGESDAASKISTPDTVTSGTGLRMLLDNERTQLLSNVKSIIDEKHSPVPAP